MLRRQFCIARRGADKPHQALLPVRRSAVTHAGRFHHARVIIRGDGWAGCHVVASLAIHYVYAILHARCAGDIV